MSPGPRRDAAVVDFDISDFGGRHDGSDTTPAWNAAIAAAALASGSRTIRFAAGDYAFLTPPGPIRGSVRIVGEGQMNTSLIRAYQGSQDREATGGGGIPPDPTCDFIVMRGKGSVLRGLTILAGSNTSGGTGLHITADENNAGGYHTIDDVWITGGAPPHTEIPDASGTFLIPLFMEAAHRASGPLVGIRVVHLSNVTVWQGTWFAVDWFNCIACEWYGGGVYQGGGTTEAIAVGGPVSQANYISANNVAANISGSGYIAPPR